MIQKLTKIKSEDRVINLIQDQVTSTVNEIIDSQIIDSVILSNITLKAGLNTIPHQLNRKLVGWFIVRQRSAATIYDTQDSNTIPDRNLFLNASAGCVVDIYVF